MTYTVYTVYLHTVDQFRNLFRTLKKWAKEPPFVKQNCATQTQSLAPAGEPANLEADGERN